MTSAELDILMWAYTRSNEHLRSQDAWYIQVMQGWEKLGIVCERVKGLWETTDRGNAWCKHILDTPYPVQVWKDPRVTT